MEMRNEEEEEEEEEEVEEEEVEERKRRSAVVWYELLCDKIWSCLVTCSVTISHRVVKTYNIKKKGSISLSEHHGIHNNWCGLYKVTYIDFTLSDVVLHYTMRRAV